MSVNKEMSIETLLKKAVYPLQDIDVLEIHDHRMLRTITPVSELGYIPIFLCRIRKNGESEFSELFWCSSLMEQIIRERESPFVFQFYLTEYSFKRRVHRFLQKLKDNGTEFFFFQTSKEKHPHQEEYFKELLWGKLMDRQFTVEDFLVSKEILVAEILEGEETRFETQIYTEEGYLWETRSELKIKNLSFLSTDTAPFRNLILLSRYGVSRRDKGCVVSVMKGEKLFYLSGMRNEKVSDESQYYLNKDIRMATKFTDEEEALRTVLRYSGKDKPIFQVEEYTELGAKFHLDPASIRY